MTTYAEIDATLTAPGQFFEIDEIEIRGVPTRVWKHTPRSLRDVLEQSRTQGGDTAFLVLGAERLTHFEHHARVAAFARRLVDDFGVSPGDRVVIAMRNYPEWSLAFFAAAAIGAVAVPLNASSRIPARTRPPRDHGSRSRTNASARRQPRSGRPSFPPVTGRRSG